MLLIIIFPFIGSLKEDINNIGIVDKDIVLLLKKKK